MKTEFQALVAAAPRWCQGLSDWETICNIHRLAVEDGQLASGWPLARVQAIFSAMKAEKEVSQAAENAAYAARLAATAEPDPDPTPEELIKRESAWYRAATTEMYRDRGE